MAFLAISLASTAVMAGCGGDGTDSGSDENREPEKATGSRMEKQRPAATPDADDTCPLTAQQVSDVLGKEVVADAGCSFFPTDDVLPNASYNRQFDVAMSDEGLAQNDYEKSDAVAGVGDEAYSRDGADGVWLLVRAGNRYFEVRVDSADAAADLAAAKKLAALVLNR